MGWQADIVFLDTKKTSCRFLPTKSQELTHREAAASFLLGVIFLGISCAIAPLVYID